METLTGEQFCRLAGSLLCSESSLPRQPHCGCLRPLMPSRWKFALTPCHYSGVHLSHSLHFLFPLLCLCLFILPRTFPGYSRTVCIPFFNVLFNFCLSQIYHKFSWLLDIVLQEAECWGRLGRASSRWRVGVTEGASSEFYKGKKILPPGKNHAPALGGKIPVCTSGENHTPLALIPGSS